MNPKPQPAKVVVLIPSYNTGVILESVVKAALAEHDDVWLLVDGSDDGSEEKLLALQNEFPGFRCIVSSVNREKVRHCNQGLPSHKQPALPIASRWIPMVSIRHPTCHTCSA